MAVESSWPSAKASLMESYDSSPDCTRATNNSDAKNENSPGGSEGDETISLSSSVNASAVSGLTAQGNGINNRSVKKKALKNFGNLKTFRRRARSRTIDQTSMDTSDDVVTRRLKPSLEVFDETPHYMQPTRTSASKGKRANLQENHQNSEFCFDYSDLSSSHSSQSNMASSSVRSLQNPLTALNVRNVKILIKTTSFKPKRSSLNHSQVSQDVQVDRATCSSTLKDSNFAKHVELVPGEIEAEKISAMKVCRYHHCSLHGNCGQNHVHVPPQKRFLYKRRRSLKKQRSMKPRSEHMHSSDKKKYLEKGQMISNVQPLVQGESDSVAASYVNNVGDSFTLSALEVKMSETHSISASNVLDSSTDINTKPKTRLFGDGYSGIQESDLVEIVFGETSYPEENYQESLNRVKQGNFCLKCSCIKTQPNESKKIADVDLPRHEVSDSNRGDGCNHYTRQNGAAYFSDTCASARSLKLDKQISTQNKDTSNSNGGECEYKASDRQNASTPDNFDEIRERNSVISSASDGQTPKYGNPKSEGKFTTEVMPVGDSVSGEVMQVKNLEVNTRLHEENKPRFSKFEHISMWNIIHQHMAESVAAESEKKPLHVVSGSNVLPAKGSPALCREISDSDIGILNDDCETQDIEVRKLFAIKLVREAIEKILLPEVRDQTSDDQSITSDSTHEQDLYEKNQDEGYVQESPRECEADKGEVNAPADLNEVGLTITDISGQEIVQTDKKFGSKSEKKAPKHWSNLKKWILLQRFIKELEKVRKFNPGSPQHLPLKPDPESENVNLRPQTVDEKKKAEEWMLDYALRQAVSQLAPTQKRKVSLLVKAFETVVTPNEDNSQKFDGKTHEVDKSVPKENAADKEAPEIVELKSGNGETALEHNLRGIQDYTVGNIETKDPDYGCVESQNCDSLKLEMKVKGEADQEAVPVPELGVFQEGTEYDSKESDMNNGSHNIQLERQNYIIMWHSIYQHVVAGIAAKVGSQLLDGTDDDEIEDCNEFLKKCNGDYFLKSDAVKLVQEAVDEILLPEIEDDSSDTQSVTSDFSPDQEREGEFSVNQEDLKLKSARTSELKSKNWSKLKKLILLKRSIKTLEKARKLNQWPPRQLSVMPDPELEKADLRHQMMDDRKKAEQWMLDYAVQHIVTKLTPARKRRVSMLVEAFESVVPLPELLAS